MADDQARMSRSAYRELKFEYDRTSGKYLVDPKSAADRPLSLYGFRIMIDADLPPNTIEFRDNGGRLLGTIVNVSV